MKEDKDINDVLDALDKLDEQSIGPDMIHISLDSLIKLMNNHALKKHVKINRKTKSFKRYFESTPVDRNVYNGRNGNGYQPAPMPKHHKLIAPPKKE
jgi:hypothetical protein